jgi:hypothetical protein
MKPPDLEMKRPPTCQVEGSRKPMSGTGAADYGPSLVLPRSFRQRVGFAPPLAALGQALSSTAWRHLRCRCLTSDGGKQ